MVMSKSFVLGLDIGIGSVGWGIIDQNQNIIDAGVRLFPEADKTFNDSRRNYRSTRRLIRRRRHRIERVYNLLNEYGILNKGDIIDYSHYEETPYHIRAKGLKAPLSTEELAIALLHLAKRRGIHNLDNIEDDASINNELSTYEQIKNNNRLLHNRYVCEVQVERLEIDGQIRGHKNRFQTSDYVKEARKLLATQRKTYTNITSEFIEKYIQLLKVRREYYEGPGHGSEYGWDQDIKKWYENMMGKCSYFPDQLRAVKQAYSSELFNVLNDLNNLTLNREEQTKLTYEEKKRIIDNIFKKYKTVSLKRIANEIGINEHDIKGYRVNTKGNPLFTTLGTYHSIKGITTKESILGSPESMDAIAEKLTIYQGKYDKSIELSKLDIPLNKDEIDRLSDLDFSGTHSLSLKMIKLLLPDLWKTSQNQMQLITKHGYKPKDVDYSNRKYIPYNQIDDCILSPVVKRSFKQTVRVINAVIKKYGIPSEIIIELAREKNSDDKKKFLRDLQKKNEAINKQVHEKLESLDINPSKGLFQMLRLWHLQDGICMYSLDPIPIEDLMNHPSKYEIDHIIPRSVSFDDSQNNRVLVKKEENQKKGNLTPYQYFKSNKSSISYDKFKTHVLQLAKSTQKMSRKKKDYLLEERDINKYTVQKDFINRNLVDTRYATREILNTLQQFFEVNNKRVKIKSINGSFTNYLRKLWDFNKDRGADYKHHAEDALIVAMANHIFEYKKAFKADQLLYTNDQMVDTETGEILTEGQFNAAFTEKMNKIKAIKKYDSYKYSHKVDMKPNRQLMNDTLFSTRKIDGDQYVVNKITNIYDADNDKLKKLLNKNPEDLLMYHHDPQTFEKLKRVFEQYSDAKNPLAQYYTETKEYLTKYSKKGKGPAIKSVKYLGNKLKEHHDLSHKFRSIDKKVVSLSLKPFRMDVFNEDGIYKFVTIRYKDLKEIKDRYVIDKQLYQEKIKEKKIKSIDSFQFSLYKNDILILNDEEYRFIGVNSDTRNMIEVNKVRYDYKEFCKTNDIKNNRIKLTIGRTTSNFKKLQTNVLGDTFSNRENLKFEYFKNSIKDD